MSRPLHPKERSLLNRRDFLRRAAAAGVAMPSLAAILAACGKGAQTNVSTGGGASGAAGANPYGTGGVSGAPYPLARTDHPVTWNIPPDNQPIASGLKPEKGPLKIYNWNYYLSTALMRQFGDKYGVKVQLTTFNDMDEAIAKVNSGQADFDMIFGLQIFALGRLIAAKLLQPISHDYFPNFSKNVWDSLQSPFYDQESRYTVPYSIWNTGIMWRNDMIKTDIAKLSNPYDIFWHGAPKNKTHLLSNARDSLGMAMMWRGETDLNTGDPAVISKAKDDIAQVVKATNAQFDHTDYTDVPKGQAWLHQSWSGNVGSAFYFLPAGDTAPNISYYWPAVTPGIPGNVDNDTIAVLSTAKNPVLAHLFIDWILDSKHALTNYTTYTGYQMPQKGITPSQLVGSQVVPAHLATTVVKESDFAKGYRELELAPDVESTWDSAYQQIQAGV